ncbi:unnamed protein product, partial [marine sediment metagenome]
VTNIKNWGINILGDYSLVKNSLVSYCGDDGIASVGDYNTIEHNYVYGSGGSGGPSGIEIEAGASFNVVTCNTVNGGGSWGIEVHSHKEDPATHDIIISNNVVYDGTVGTGYGGYDGVFSYNINITDNRLFNSYISVRLMNDVVISGNTIVVPDIRYAFKSSTNGKIVSNTPYNINVTNNIFHCKTGYLMIFGLRNSRIEYNTIISEVTPRYWAVLVFYPTTNDVLDEITLEQ